MIIPCPISSLEIEGNSPKTVDMSKSLTTSEKYVTLHQVAYEGQYNNKACMGLMVSLVNTGDNGRILEDSTTCMKDQFLIFQ